MVSTPLYMRPIPRWATASIASLDVLQISRCWSQARRLSMVRVATMLPSRPCPTPTLSLTDILRATRSTHGPISHSKQMSDPPYTLIGVINSIINDSSQSAEDRTRACVSLCWFGNAALRITLTSTSLQITWLSMIMTLSILPSCLVPFGRYRVYYRGWFLIQMFHGRKMRSLIPSRCFWRY
jgi:hypothetical protein